MVAVAPSTTPSLPEEREKKHLPPKSYADAVEEDPTPEVHANGSDEPVDQTGAKANGATPAKPQIYTASVLRDVAPDTQETASPDARGSGPDPDRQFSNEEYSATGLDETPKPPPKQKPRKSKSQKPRESQSKSGSDGSLSESNNTNGTEPSQKVEVNGTSGSKQDVKAISIDTCPGEKNGPLQRKTTSASKVPSKKNEIASGRIAGQRWKQSGIRFAPMNIPLQRRLQTLVVLFHTLCIAISVSVFFFLCAIPLFWPLLIPYMIYCLTSKASTSGALSHRQELVRRSSIWSLFASYFPMRLHRTHELPPTRKYILGYHPHGIISMGAFASFATEALGFSQLFPDITNSLLTLDSNFRIPIYRDYLLALGVSSVSKESCENLLSKGGPNNEGMGRAITIVIGGAAESLDAQPYSLRLILKRRKGFVKMAIRTGADLVPVLAFGENDIYDQFNAESHPAIHKLQMLVKKALGFTIPLFHARGVFNYDVGLMPYRRPVNIVVGKPILVTQSSKPAQEDIDRVHEEYVQELEQLWDTWKDKFAPHRKEEMLIHE
ncbi:diacylglycerol O-acyltransferas-like protein 2B [Amylocarpus encephaloides]|uniref:diacylglycerol O-acyltransferase n=1 Tax=Amylocarpus encephaloides TaxID=45428 RepID=A0A9P7YMG7_9HELO|nr:diacylglycerol O-acyltransferas-like protein 2B [Amylocarpus encephaloides]